MGTVPVDLYPLRNGTTRTRSEIWSELIKTPEQIHSRRFDVFDANFKQVLQFASMFLLLTLNKSIPTG